MVKLIKFFFVTVECWTPTSHLLSCGDLYAEAANDFECAIDVFERNDEENHSSLFKAALQGPDALKVYLEGFPRHAHKKDRRVRSLAFDFPATSSSISTSELKFK